MAIDLKREYEDQKRKEKDNREIVKELLITVKSNSSMEHTLDEQLAKHTVFSFMSLKGEAKSEEELLSNLEELSKNCPQAIEKPIDEARYKSFVTAMALGLKESLSQ